MTESFAELFEASLKGEQPTSEIQKGKVIKIDDKYAIVDAGYKSECFMDIAQFKDQAGNLKISVGDEVDVMVESLADDCGSTSLSHEKAQKTKAWKELEKIFEEKSIVEGVINGKVKGGFTVELMNGNIKAFLPGSLVADKPVREADDIINNAETMQFKVIKLDQKRNNVVVSRKAVIDKENFTERESLLKEIQEGQEREGFVKNLTDYGAFVDLGGLDGLLHITDMAWKRVKHPSEIVSVGQQIKVKVLSVKQDNQNIRISLGMKQLTEDPWTNIESRYPIGTKIAGKVTNIADYGCFVELQPGVEGLVHVSEMDWTSKNINPAKFVDVGQTVEVKVLDINPGDRRISLGLKQCKPNPWEEFAQKYNKGDRVTGKIKSITDFGMFIGLDGNIDGLVHLSDISWKVPGEQAVHNYKKGDEVTAVILQIHPEQERVSLGIRQLENDPVGKYTTDNKRGSIVKGRVTSVTARGATVDLGDGVEGYIRASDISTDHVDDATKVLSEGQEIEAKYMGLERKSRQISLSIKAKDEADERQVIESNNAKNQEISESSNTMREAFQSAKGE
ncbi:MAG: 30S ribosomal protein S1 [Succinivibrionaceae bacterium]|nr:30S ribosomal protein S1 [Succinivibrionaceae bacterium]